MFKRAGKYTYDETEKTAEDGDSLRDEPCENPKTSNQSNPNAPRAPRAVLKTASSAISPDIDVFLVLSVEFLDIPNEHLRQLHGH